MGASVGGVATSLVAFIVQIGRKTSWNGTKNRTNALSNCWKL